MRFGSAGKRDALGASADRFWSCRPERAARPLRSEHDRSVNVGEPQRAPFASGRKIQRAAVGKAQAELFVFAALVPDAGGGNVRKPLTDDGRKHRAEIAGIYGVRFEHLVGKPSVHHAQAAAAVKAELHAHHAEIEGKGLVAGHIDFPPALHMVVGFADGVEAVQ